MLDLEGTGQAAGKGAAVKDIDRHRDQWVVVGEAFEVVLELPLRLVGNGAGGAGFEYDDGALSAGGAQDVEGRSGIIG